MIVPIVLIYVGLLEGFYNHQMFVIDLQIYTSSTNRPIVDETVDGMLLMEMRNSNDRSIVPCGTPDITPGTDDITLATANV